jgi:cysteinyl-tRNA synthetase
MAEHERIRPVLIEKKTWRVSEDDMRGLAIRLDMLSSHYRQPKDLTAEGLNRAARTLRRWLALAEPGLDIVPIGVLEALSDDLNTPAAIAEMHRIAKTDRRGLFAAMKLLGLIPGEGRAIDYDIVDEVKTLPIDHLPIVAWEVSQ